ncbi:MAG TPA: hypothetical protein VG435_18410, partial [Acidimicrobiales bacterium]|nr:hypothetical protein [Acidimicrobiales bacterium]
YRVALPRLFGAYTAHLQVAGQLADGATVRTLGLVRPDVAADWQEGELMLQARAVDPASVIAAADAVQLLEGALTRA